MQWQIHWRRVAPAGEQQVVAEAAQAAGQVGRPAALEVGVDQVSQGHADRRAGHEIGVERFDSGDAEQEAARRLGPGAQPLQAIAKRAGAMEPAEHHRGMGEQLVEQQIDRHIIFHPSHVSQVRRREVGRQLRTGLMERQQVGVGL